MNTGIQGIILNSTKGCYNASMTGRNRIDTGTTNDNNSNENCRQYRSRKGAIIMLHENSTNNTGNHDENSKNKSKHTFSPFLFYLL